MLDHETQITTEGVDPHPRMAVAEAVVAAADMEVDATDDLDRDLETADETDGTDLDLATDPTEGRRRRQATGV